MLQCSSQVHTLACPHIGLAIKLKQLRFSHHFNCSSSKSVTICSRHEKVSGQQSDIFPGNIWYPVKSIQCPLSVLSLALVTLLLVIHKTLIYSSSQPWDVKYTSSIHRKFIHQIILKIESNYIEFAIFHLIWNINRKDQFIIPARAWQPGRGEGSLPTNELVAAVGNEILANTRTINLRTNTRTIGQQIPADNRR